MNYSGVFFRLFLLISVVLGTDAAAISSDEARGNSIVWLEQHQNLDGSWGAEPTKGLVTAEALLALAKAGRGDSPVAGKAKAWLVNQEFASVDFRARAVRALEAAGVDVSEQKQELWDMASENAGWSTTFVDDPVGLGGEASAPTSYDTALGLAALYSASNPPDGIDSVKVAAALQTVVGAVRGDYAWSGDQVPYDETADGLSDLIMSAEIMRAVAAVPGSRDALGVGPVNRLLGAASSSTPTLELASRLASIWAWKTPNGYPSISADGGIALLLDDARFTASNVWSDTDPFVNAMGLLAITTDPDGEFTVLAAVVDSDGDGIPDEIDADADGDGVLDGDVNGNGTFEANEDEFAGDPNEWTDSDGDGIGNNADDDDDNDEVPDVDELANGTNPFNPNSDGDLEPDGVDIYCPLIAYGVDWDGDGVCGTTSDLDLCEADIVPCSCDEVSVACDECDGDPSGWIDTDDDALCNESDLDDDGDNFSDVIELAFGSDPLNAASIPLDVAVVDPNGDFDKDGLTNYDEATATIFGTSPYVADTDLDGATDYAEVDHGGPGEGSANDSLVTPGIVVGVFGSIGTEDNGTSPSDNPVVNSTTGHWGSMTGGQPTPVATLWSDLPATGGGLENQAGFQPQVYLAFDSDGDGLVGMDEVTARTNLFDVDTDGDGFVDGDGGDVLVRNPETDWDLDGDGKIDGEFGRTDPLDGTDHPGKPGDVAPLGNPDGKINAADGVVQLRIMKDPTVLEGVPAGPRRDIAEQAADAAAPYGVYQDDTIRLIKAIQSGTNP